MDYRQTIVEEAAVMFRTYGIRAVTMDMLASHLGISKRTIYEVFRDKDELLQGVLKWMREI
jgi:AcrR family transcriptional regulator